MLRITAVSSCVLAIACTSPSEPIQAVIPGRGLSATETGRAVTLQANTTYLQRRIFQVCATGISSVSEDGTITCAPPMGMVAGPGVTVTPAADVTVAADFGGSGVSTKVARADHTHYTRTLLVSTTDDAAANAAALRAAMDAASAATSASPFLVKLEPGTYDLGGRALTLHPWVHLEGSGEDITTLVSTATGYSWAAVVGAPHAAIRQLTVQITSTTTNYGAAIHVSNADHFRMEHVTATATGPNWNTGVLVSNSPSVEVSSSHLSAAWGTGPRGLDVHDGNDWFLLSDSSVQAEGGSSSNTAIFVGHSTSVRIIRSGLSATGASPAGLNCFDGGGGAPVSVLLFGDTVHSDQAPVANLHCALTVSQSLVGRGAIATSPGATTTCTGVSSESGTFGATSCPP